MQVSVEGGYSTSNSKALASAYQNGLPNLPSTQPSEDALVVSTSLTNQVPESDLVNLDFNQLYKSLTITSRQIIDKLNELLKSKLPDGLQSLKAEDLTPESSADKVITGIGAMFTAFAKQNGTLDSEELVAKFISEAKKGVEQGYDDAQKTLESLGALKIDGVGESISRTKDLILEKLEKLAESKLEELTSVSSQSAKATKDLILQQGGISVLDLAA